MEIKISDEMELVLAKAINNKGKLTHGIVNSVYSSNDKSKFRNVVQKLQSIGYVRKGKQFGTFVVRVRESKDKKHLIWLVSPEIIEMANNLKENEKSVEIEEELMEKHRI